jgi:hypothetical protein
MKDDIYEKFADKALQYLNGTEAFLKEQLPDYFQQVVKYHAVEGWIYVGIGVLVTLAAIYFTKRVLIMGAADKYNESYVALFIIGAVVAVFSFGITIKNFTTALKATIAPKVFIIDYLRGKE